MRPEFAMLPAPPAILPDSDPLLRTISEQVTRFDDALVDVAAQMISALLHRNGLGLSAVQIGKPIRMIVVRDDNRLIVMVNPVITRRLRRDAIEHEGCLSVPPIKWKRIARPAKCEAEWQDLDGVRQSGGFSNLVARAVQHECDHLDGVLITDLPRAA